MRLLITTQKVDKNDALLGFTHRWIQEFAKHCERVTVICLERGEYDLPSNVTVLSLGKERFTILKRFLYIFRFYKYAWRERRNYDSVFVHMNREYVLLGGFLWRFLGKKIGLWFVHFETPFSLRIAEKLTHKIFTASKESFGLSSSKVHVLGHGIDLTHFAKNRGLPFREPLQFLYVGKITPIKNVDIFVEMAYILNNSWGKSFVINLVGPTTTKEDELYKTELKRRIREYGLEGKVQFVGALPYQEIPKMYAKAHVILNACPTGGIDKMVVEGMASHTLTFASNETFREIFGPHANDLLYPYQNAKVFALKVKNVFNKNEYELEAMREYLNEQSQNHSLKNLITRILKNYL